MTNKKQHIICPDDNELARFIEGTLPEEREDYILKHLDICEECAETVRLATEALLIEDKYKAMFKEDILCFPEYHVATKKKSDADERNHHVKGSSILKEEILREIQGKDDTCAIKVQQLILHDFGIDITEEQLIEEAKQEGWYIEGKGMLLQHVGKLIEKHGVKIQRKQHATIEDVLKALQEEKRVIVGVDSGELWCETIEEIEKEIHEDLIEEIPDHVLLVADVELENGEIKNVIIKDPGIIDQTKKFTVDKFIDAWKDSDFFLIKTTKSIKK